MEASNGINECLNKNQLGLIIGSVVGGLVLIGIIATAIYLRSKKNSDEGSDKKMRKCESQK